MTQTIDSPPQPDAANQIDVVAAHEQAQLETEARREHHSYSIGQRAVAGAVGAFMLAAPALSTWREYSPA